MRVRKVIQKEQVNIELDFDKKSFSTDTFNFRPQLKIFESVRLINLSLEKFSAELKKCE